MNLVRGEAQASTKTRNSWRSQKFAAQFVNDESQTIHYWGVVTSIRAWIFNNTIAAVAVVMLTLAVRLLIPTGFMPGSDARGLTVSICTGHGAVTTTIDLSDRLPPKPAKAKDCPFALGMTGAPLAAVDVAMAASPLIVAPLVATHAIADLVMHRVAAPPPPAQAPPVFA